MFWSSSPLSAFLAICFFLGNPFPEGSELCVGGLNFAVSHETKQLGHFVSGDGSRAQTVRVIKSKMWGLKWANRGVFSSKLGSFRKKVLLYHKWARSVLALYLPAVIPNKQSAKSLKAIQYRVASSFYVVPMWEGEPDKSYFVRRMRSLCGVLGELTHSWAFLLAKAHVTFREHVFRHPDHIAFACLTGENTSDLRIHRLSFPSALRHGDCGRIGRRIRWGHPIRLEMPEVFNVGADNEHRDPKLSEMKAARILLDWGVS